MAVVGWEDRLFEKKPDLKSTLEAILEVVLIITSNVVRLADDF